MTQENFVSHLIKSNDSDAQWPEKTTKVYSLEKHLANSNDSYAPWPEGKWLMCLR